MRTCVYLHRERDTGRVFYVGLGSARRAFETQPSKRSQFWRRVFDAHGLAVEILAWWPDRASASEHERFLVGCFRDMGCRLVNLTDGGDGGRPGYRCTPEQKEELARIRREWWTPERRAKMSAAQKARPMTPERREQLRANSAKAAGVPWTAERRAAASAERKARGFSERQREQLLAASKKAAKDPAVQEKKRRAQLGRKHSAQTRAKLRDRALEREELRRLLS